MPTKSSRAKSDARAAQRTPRILIPQPDAAFALGCSVNHVKQLVREGKLTAVKFGRLTPITAESLDRFVASLKGA